MNPLHALLGASQAASMAPDPLQQQRDQIALPVPEDPNILVESGTNDPYAYESPEAVIRRDMGLGANMDAAQRQGMFGIKGTLRDVLGLVGDAFLIQGGKSPIYGPRREQENLSDAMAGFTENPIAAIERVAGINPAVAQDMYDKYLLGQDRTADNSRLDAAQQLDQSKERRIVLDNLKDYASRLLSAAIATGDEQTIQDMVLRLSDAAGNYGVTLEELDLDVGMSPTALKVYAQAGMTPYQQARVPQYERGLDISQQNADTSVGRLNESRRSNRVREGIQRTNEAGRNERSERTDQRIRDLDDGRGSGGPRPLRGTQDNPTSSLRIRPVGQR